VSRLLLGARRATRPTGAAPAREPEAAPEREATGEPRRIGVLGGTFDPPHIGHLWLGTLARDALSLDRVLFMPAGQPPHKRRGALSSATDRLLMTRLAIAGDAAFELTTLEVERPGPSYTVDSVEELLRQYGDEARLYLLMSSDSFAQVDSWREPERLLSLVEWAIGGRPGSPLPDRAALRERFGKAAERIHLLDGPTLDVSSTELRRRVAAGLAIRYLVPRGVEELIRDRGLYRGPR
jgi:nicotinate-nucleotide adenylyltransferase